MPANNGKHWMPVNEKIRKAINKSNDENIAVEIELDMENIVYETPKDFSIELQKHPKAEAFF